MSCLHLKKMSFNGTRKYDSWNGKAGEMYSYSNVLVRCGYCEECRRQKSNEWVIRNFYEQKAHKNMCFVTLTYKENPYIFIKKDLQNFKKRLRRYIEYHFSKKIRTFDVGEIGERTKRRHFHMIIYGFEDENAELIGKNKKGYPIYYSKIIDKCWGLGLTTYQKIDNPEAVIRYVTLYTTIRENEAKQYRSSRENMKKLYNKLKEKNQDLAIRPLILKNLSDAIEKMNQEKAFYHVEKEYNTWSQKIGWEEFYKQYNENYIFTEYVDNSGIGLPTPNSWIKKLANMGSENAKREMLKRQAEGEKQTLEKAENEARTKNEMRKKLEKLTDTQKEAEL